MLNSKGTNLSIETDFAFQNSSSEELQSRNAQDMKDASSNLDGIAVRNSRTYANVPGGFLRGPIHQNWVIIRQNELLSRQNEQIIAQNAAIISLLQSNSADQ